MAKLFTIFIYFPSFSFIFFLRLIAKKEKMQKTSYLYKKRFLKLGNNNSHIITTNALHIRSQTFINNHLAN